MLEKNPTNFMFTLEIKMSVKKYFMSYYCLSLFHRDCGEYVRYVFSVGPGAGSLLGFLAVIAFLPATVRCKKVGKSRQLDRRRTETKGQKWLQLGRSRGGGGGQSTSRGLKVQCSGYVDSAVDLTLSGKRPITFFSGC